ncbi:hypothetical protein KEM48_007529 [Puccinia striiformis f. sp. tritici PST-130]|nr:hypothetical protein KEM48_007529 [Puccinia striiformis f. sp. tritici PST-130]
MSSDSIHNGVFSGKNALLNYYNPDHNPPTPMVELPDHPYIPDGVRIYAKLMNFLPAGNVKSLPALNMLQKGLHEQEINAGTDTVVEYSSGSTALSLGIISKILGIDRAEIYITNKTTQTKINMLRLFGLELTVFGGPSQPAMDDPIGGIAAARDRGAHPGCFNPDQYDNPAVSEMLDIIRTTTTADQTQGVYLNLELWGSCEVDGSSNYQQLPQIKVFAAPGGTTGTLTGTATYLKGVKPEIMSVAAFTASGERVPGPPQEAFDHSLLLCRMGIVVGPSSGMSLAAVYSFLERRKSLGSLDELRDEQGEITCVFMCCDFPFQYVDEYIQKCSPGLFPPIHNQELLKVDLNPYLLEWELQPLEAKKMMCGGSGDTHQDEVMVLDLRNVAAFKNSSILNSISIDVRLGLDDPNPFSSAAELIELHKQLALSFQAPNGKLFKTLYTFGRTKARVVVVCQNGTACRTATSVMRSKGIEAYCIIGGIDGWLRAGLPLHTRSFNRSSLYPTTTQCPLEVILSSAYLANPPLVPDPTLVHH